MGRKHRVSTRAYMLLTDGGTVTVGALALVALAAGSASGSPALEWVGVGLVCGVSLAIVALMTVVGRSYVQLVGGLRRGSQLLGDATARAESVAVADAATASEQAAAAAEISATVEQLATTAATIAENAATIAAAAEDAAETMSTTRESVAAIADRSLELGRRSQQIAEILALIEEIAEQTNLLALNAAIEAARAGETGKGFAVVAAEVRRLAERSLESSRAIHEIVATIGTETNSTILATEHGTRQAQEVTALMDRTAELVREAATAAEQQRAAAGHVAAAVHQISASADALAAERQHRADTAASVAAESSRLSSILSVLRAGPTDRGSVVGNFVKRHLRESGVPIALLGLTTALVVAGVPRGWLLALALVPGVAAVCGLGWIRAKRARRLLGFGDRVRAAVASLGGVPDELERQTRSASAAVAEQAAAVAQTGTSVEQLAASAGTIAASVAGVTDAAVETRETVLALESTVDGIAAHSHRLTDASRSVGEILELIDGVAEQTNLLALNAAIEAARCGVAGKGFAVVAEEVQKLAGRSLEASGSIRAIVDAVREEIDATRAAAEGGAARVRDVGRMIEQTLEMLDESALATRQQQAAADQVAAAVQQLRASGEAIAAEHAQDLASPVAAAVDALQDAVDTILTHGSAQVVRRIAPAPLAAPA